MSAALCALHESVKQDPLPYKNLIPSFISILKQASSSRARPQVYGSCVPAGMPRRTARPVMSWGAAMPSCK